MGRNAEVPVSLLSTKRYKLRPREAAVVEVIGEGYVHPLVGTGECAGVRIGGRRTVFDSPSPGLLLGAGEWRVEAHEKPLDLIVACAHETTVGPAGIRPIAPSEEHQIGTGTRRRTVRVILGYGGPSQRLRVGETVNRRGGWSSWPPHSFDKDPANASKFEERFYCFTDPKDGDAYLVRRGVFRGGSDIDVIERIESGKCIDVPLGYHPIVAGPGTRLCYFWAYVSPEDKQYPQWAEDLNAYK